MAVGTTDASRLGRFDYTGTRSECGGHGIDFGAKNKAGTARLHRGQCDSQRVVCERVGQDDVPEMQQTIAPLPMPPPQREPADSFESRWGGLQKVEAGLAFNARWALDSQ